jgi:hypothetical protein
MMKRFWFLAPLIVLAIAVMYYHQWQHWLSHGTGSYDTPGVAHHYNFFSGSGSDISELTIAASLASSTVILWRAHTCHRYWWCWRHGNYNLDGTPYKLCSKHHPDDVPSVAEAVAAYEEADGGD